MRPIESIAESLGIVGADLIPYGRDKAKISLDALSRPSRGKGNLILVSAITPTPAGEGKTTTSVGLAMGLCRIGKRAVCALREPSLGPVFGVKGGGTGGGKSQLVPANDINLHFTGDLHAISAANNLLAAIVDNSLHFETHGIDPRRVSWRRAMDMNDRSLRDITLGLGGRSNGVPRESGFDITAASEVMAILCLASSYADLETRLARIVVGQTRELKPVTAGDLGASAAMTALLKDALLPNLVQTAEGTPAIVHGGPFANIAHGCSSVIGTRLAQHYADYVVTEGGFGFDLGGEKFLDIKCRDAEIWPKALVLVATLRALKFHGGVAARDSGSPNREALEKGLSNLDHHVESATRFGLPVVVAINSFNNDTKDELEYLTEKCKSRNVPVVSSLAFAEGGKGCEELASVVAHAVENSVSTSRFTYELSQSYEDKLHAIATKIYGAEGVDIDADAKTALARLVSQGFTNLPVCVAKTQLSISDDATKHGRPRGFRVTVRQVRLSAGAGFIVALLGDVMTMPGLPKVPAAANIRIEAGGRILGLMQNE